MYTSMLSHGQLTGHLQVLLKYGLLEYDEQMKVYKITTRGIQFIELYTKMAEMLKPITYLKRPRSYERYGKKSDRFAGSKAPRNPISVGEEYIVTIEETSESGAGVAKIRGFVVLVNNSNPGERVKIRIKQVSRNHAVADVISS